MEVKYVYDKGIGRLNEDAYVIKDNLFAVFDGASSLVKFEDRQNRTGGRIASETAAEIFSKNNKSLKELAIETNDEIREKMQEKGIDTSRREALWAVAAAAIIIRENKVEYVQIGDCAILVINRDGSISLPAGFEDHDLETMKMWKQLADKGERNIREKLMPQIIKVRKTANIAYGALNGDPAAEKFLKSGEFDLKNVNSILLFTDGLLIPKTDPESPEKFEEIARIYKEKGLEEVLSYVRSIEKTDPDCQKYPRFKQHDDIAAISIKFD